MSCFPPNNTTLDNTTIPIAAAPTFAVQPYTIVNYTTAAIFYLLVLLSIVSFIRVHRLKGCGFDSHRLLILHSLAFALTRGVLGVLPGTFYKELLCHPPEQAALDLLPEALFQSVFIILNCMWYVGF